MMMMMMMMMCKRLAQVPMLCVPIYNMKLAMMQKTPIFTTFSAHTKMAADKRGQIEVFARKCTGCICTYACIYIYIKCTKHRVCMSLHNTLHIRVYTYVYTYIYIYVYVCNF